MAVRACVRLWGRRVAGRQLPINLKIQAHRASTMKIRFLPETFFLSVVHRRRWIFDPEDPDVRDVALIVKRRGLSHKERGESPPHPPPQLLLIPRVILRDMAASRSLMPPRRRRRMRTAAEERLSERPGARRKRIDDTAPTRDCAHRGAHQVQRRRKNGAEGHQKDDRDSAKTETGEQKGARR